MANVDLTKEELERAANAIKNMAANGVGGYSGKQPRKLVVSADMIRAMSKILGSGSHMNKAHTMEVDFDGDADNS